LGPQGRATVEDIDVLARAVAAAAPALPPGTLVALAAADGPAFLAGFLALRQHRWPTLLLDARTPPSEQRRCAQSLGAALLLVAPDPWPRRAADFVFVPIAPADAARHLGEEIAVVKLTSGSTGAPRGIVTPEAALLADEAALTRTMGLREDERILAAVPLSHSYGLSSIALPALLRGMRLVVPPPTSPTNPFGAMATARDGGVTFLPTAPAYLQALLRVSSPPPPPAELRLVIAAGAPLRATTARRFREVYGHSVHVFYGASECGGITFDREGNAAESGTLGEPVQGVRITLEPCEGIPPAEGSGMVTVHSPAVAAGYLPATDSDSRLGPGRFVTGDLGRFREGALELLGRADAVINIKGKKVQPREVERVLQRLPGVEEAAVVGICRGDGEPLVRAVLAPQPSPENGLRYEAVVAWCRAHLAEHKVPRSILFVPRLPRNARGKVDRAALRQLTADR
jgi:acyl-CoA synthetase (AMP-forming)/AMP-acid ligase II